MSRIQPECRDADSDRLVAADVRVRQEPDEEEDEEGEEDEEEDDGEEDEDGDKDTGYSE